MIKVLIKKVGNNFHSLEVKGHANSAPHGEDLVCAAVSAIVTGGINAIKEQERFAIELKEGYASIEAKETISAHDEIVIETIIEGLTTVARDNAKFIKITNL